LKSITLLLVCSNKLNTKKKKTHVFFQFSVKENKNITMPRKQKLKIKYNVANKLPEMSLIAKKKKENEKPVKN
jgi:hypothetical protein